MTGRAATQRNKELHKAFKADAPHDTFKPAHTRSGFPIEGIGIRNAIRAMLRLHGTALFARKRMQSSVAFKIFEPNLTFSGDGVYKVTVESYEGRDLN